MELGVLLASSARVARLSNDSSRFPSCNGINPYPCRFSQCDFFFSVLPSCCYVFSSCSSCSRSAVALCGTFAFCHASHASHLVVSGAPPLSELASHRRYRGDCFTLKCTHRRLALLAFQPSPSDGALLPSALGIGGSPAVSAGLRGHLLQVSLLQYFPWPVFLSAVC